MEQITHGRPQAPTTLAHLQHMSYTPTDKPTGCQETMMREMASTCKVMPTPSEDH